ncbi:MAG: YfiR family protein [Aquabacterium sp.]
MTALRHLCLLGLGLLSHPVWGAPDSSNDSSMHTTPAPIPSAPSVPTPDAGTPTQEDLQRAMARVKAEYLFRFLGYVEFPHAVVPQSDSPLVIGVLGADDVFEALADTLPMRTIGARQVVRKRLSAGDSLMGVHLLYAGRRVDLLQDPLISQARTSPVLLVTDAPGGLAAGAVFNFLLIGDQLRFEASLDAASRASLKVSSRVLVLAERVMGAR